MDKLYYTLAEATAYLETDAVNLGERGLLAMAYRWPETGNTQNTGWVIDESETKREPVPFAYITPAQFSSVVNAGRKQDKASLRDTFTTLDELGRAAEIIKTRNQGIHLVREKLLKTGGKVGFLYAGMDDMYVTAEAMAAYEATPAAKVEAVPDASPSGDDWHEKARAIADECFDHDTNATPPVRDSLVRRNPVGQITGGYCFRVMGLMQERGIKSSRGFITNPATIMRDALQGDLWWAKKSK